MDSPKALTNKKWTSSGDYRDNYDRIFSKKSKSSGMVTIDIQNLEGIHKIGHSFFKIHEYARDHVLYTSKYDLARKLFQLSKNPDELIAIINESMANKINITIRNTYEGIFHKISDS